MNSWFALEALKFLIEKPGLQYHKDYCKKKASVNIKITCAIRLKIFQYLNKILHKMLGKKIKILLLHLSKNTEYFLCIGPQT